MQLTYNNFRLDQIGDLSISQQREYEHAGGDAPQRIKVTFRVQIDTFQRTHADNYGLLDQAMTALQTQHAILKWHDEESNNTWIEQTAILASADLPDDPNGWGTYHGQINLVFVFYQHDLAPQNIEATFTRTAAGNPATVTLGAIHKWQESQQQERFDPHRTHRERTTGRVVCNGQFIVRASADLATRRAELQALKTQMMTETNAASGTLVFGDFNQVVKVEDFTADIDQSIWAITWTMTASFVKFPTGSYSTVRYQAEQRDDEDGQQHLIVSGTIQADTESVARTKLTSLLATVRSQYSFSGAQPMKEDSQANAISANADGDSFVTLTFTYEYRQWRSDNLVATFAGTSLGNINAWSEEYETERFSPFRSQRRRTGGQITARGTLGVDQSLTLTARRQELIRLKNLLSAAVDVKDGVLVYQQGGNTAFNQSVRPMNFDAEINQAITGIDWSLTATFTKHPNEADYAITEFEVETRDGFDGQQFLSLKGKIDAATEAIARGRLQLLKTGTLTQYAYVGSEPTSESVTASNLQSADGDTFVELSFMLEFRRWGESNQNITFLKTGTPPAVSLGKMHQWVERYEAERFDVMRAHRNRALMTVQAAGALLAADMAASVELRRTSLLAQYAAIQAAVNGADGTVELSDSTGVRLSRLVRVVDFQAEVNQAVNSINWTMTATYVLHPTPSSYSQVVFNAEQKDELAGDQILVFSGRIAAQDEAAARAKLASLRTSVLAQVRDGASYTTALPLRQDSNASEVNTADGATVIEVAFQEEYRRWRPSIIAATFTSTNPSAPGTVNLGKVTSFQERYTARRYSDLRSQRQQAGGQVAVSGVFTVDPSLTESARRSALFAQKTAMLTAFNSKDSGTLQYHESFILRIEECSVEIDQAYYKIDWSFTGTFTRFPNETGYAIAEYTVTTRDSIEEGESLLTMSGRVAAQTEAAARVKLGTLRSSVLAANGYALGQATAVDVSVNNVDADTDGSAFLELTFSETYRKRMADVTSWTVRESSRTDIKTGFVITTISGSVTASGATAGSAYSAALSRANTLGVSSVGRLVASSINWDKRRTRESVVPAQTAAEEFVRLEFSFEYQGRLVSGRGYFEINTERVSETFGVDSENVSGFVVAASTALAEQIYTTQVKASFANRLIENERTVEQKNVFEEGAAWVAQEVRLEFSFTVLKTKANGRNGIRYEVNSSVNYLSLEERITVTGVAVSDTSANAQTFLDATLTSLGYTGLVEKQVAEEKDLATWTGAPEFFSALRFSYTYVRRLTGQATIVESEITESVQYSGTRWVGQPIPRDSDGNGGITVMQDAGQQEGRRSVRCYCISPVLTTALTWVRGKRALLTGDVNASGYTKGNFELPAEIEVQYVFAPMVEGVPSGTGENVKFYRVSGSFNEVLPNYPIPAAAVLNA